MLKDYSEEYGLLATCHDIPKDINGNKRYQIHVYAVRQGSAVHTEVNIPIPDYYSKELGGYVAQYDFISMESTLDTFMKDFYEVWGTCNPPALP